MRRQIWQTPSIRIEGEKGSHRSVSWLELFFDLFFVVAVAAISHEFSIRLSVEGLANFILSFIPIWWIWIGFTFYNERFETEGIENRFIAFLVMIPVAGFAIFAHDAYGINYTGFVLSYITGRTIITLLWARAGYYSQEFRKTAIRFTIGFTASIILSVISLFISGFGKFILFGSALLVDLGTPWLTVNLQKKLPALTTSKLPERFGLFTIIVLGEMIVSVISDISQFQDFQSEFLVFGILGIAITFGFWWIYFDFIGRRPFHKNMWVTISWSYLHLPLLISYVAVGAGLLNIVSESGALSDNARLTLTGAAGFALIFLGLLELTLERRHDEPTHKYWSSVLKVISGIVILAIGNVDLPLTTIPLLLLLFAIQLVNISYGMYVWFTQTI